MTEEEIPFQELIEMICLRPKMYTLGGTYEETVAYITGYIKAKTTPISGREFNQFVCLQYNFPTNYYWPAVIQACTSSSEAALAALQTTIAQFLIAKKENKVEELMQWAKEQALTEEGAAEQAFRKLDEALLRGDQATIEALIVDHPESHYLWAGAYPSDIAQLLEEAASRQPIKKINSTPTSCSIIASGWPFPIDIHCQEGQWKVDPTVIIEMRKKTRS